MKFLQTAALTGLVIAAVVVLALEPAAGAGVEKNVAPCSKAIIGAGNTEGAVMTSAGPVTIRRSDLVNMSRTANGELVGKVPLLVEGDKPVTVSVPPALRERVHLYYGRIVGRDGKPTTSFYRADGYGETEFRPCIGNPRTAWPGGLRIEGSAPVHLLVHEGEGGEAVVLKLGRPAARG
jgi:hypothetical protein